MTECLAYDFTHVELLSNNVHWNDNKAYLMIFFSRSPKIKWDVLKYHYVW